MTQVFTLIRKPLVRFLDKGLSDHVPKSMCGSCLRSTHKRGMGRGLFYPAKG
jgi:hypothetical protein